VNDKTQTKEAKVIRALSDRLVDAQRPIRILDAVKWSPDVREDFFAKKFTRLPKVDQTYYEKSPLGYDVEEKIREFEQIIVDIKSQLGNYHGIGIIMMNMCEEYIKACQMLQARGTEQFGNLSMILYGSSDDVFYPGGPKLRELAFLLEEVLVNLKEQMLTPLDEKRFTASETVADLQRRLSHYFEEDNLAKVMESDNIIADASAGADTIKVNTEVMFSERDIHYLEVHEGWVHVGTTINGSLQPVCTFLSKGSPSSAVTQEGLAIITEIFTYCSNPSRMHKIVSRLHALDIATQGGNFLDVFNFFREKGWDENDSYNYAVRMFRGSVPDGKPFTKDLCYTKGFLVIYNYIRLATREGLINNVPTMFVGKTLLKDLPVLNEYVQQGLIMPPKYLPPMFKDLAGLSAWMLFSLFLNKMNVDKLAINYAGILR